MTTANTVPRGIRNNNPGNIDYHVNTKWQGLVLDADRKDTRFCEFKDPTWGVRAMCVVLIGYQDRYGINTIRGIIGRWAPSNENDTLAYVTAVANAVAVKPDQALDLHTYDHLAPLVEAIIRHENGIGPKATPNTWYDRSVIDTALLRAGVERPAATVAAVPVTKETVAASGTATLGIAQLADVMPQVMQAVDSQQEHLSSGSYVRIAFAVMTIGVAVFMAYAQVKKHQAGVVA
jgi:hypothetical protein